MNEIMTIMKKVIKLIIAAIVAVANLVMNRNILRGSQISNQKISGLRKL